jgi:hypothetical protein
MSKDCAAFVRIERRNAPVQTRPGLARTVKKRHLGGLDAKGVLHTLIASKPTARMRRSIVALAPASSEKENIDGL